MWIKILENEILENKIKLLKAMEEKEKALKTLISHIRCLLMPGCHTGVQDV